MHTVSAVAEVGVDERNDEYSEDVARWLQDAGHRHAPLKSNAALHQGPKESGDDLIKYLEGLIGRKLTSRQDIHGFLKQLRTEEVEKIRVAASRRVIRETLLLGCLLAAYLHYYYWDVNLQIASLRQVQVFVPVSPVQGSGSGRGLISIYAAGGMG